MYMREKEFHKIPYWFWSFMQGTPLSIFDYGELPSDTTSGIYQLQLDDGHTVQVFCNMAVGPGGWIVCCQST